MSNRTTERETISGHHVPVDTKTGTYGALDLSKRNEARQAELNAKHKADWPKDGLSVVSESKTPILKHAMANQPRPSDVSVKGGDRYGVEDGDGNNPGATANGQRTVPNVNSKASK